MLEFFYFDLLVRGLAPALCLELSGLEWKRGKVENWKEMKTKDICPFGQLPILIDHGANGFTVAQSIAIGNYIGRKGKMVGNDDIEHAVSDMLMQCVEELHTMCINGVPTLYAALGERRKGDYSFYKETCDVLIPSKLDYLECMLKKSAAAPLFTKSGPTVGETYIFSLLYQLNLIPDIDLFKDRPKLAEFFQYMESNEKIKSILAGVSDPESKVGLMKPYYIQAPKPQE